MMPRTANLPSDLIEIHALSFARTVTSNAWVLAAIELPADGLGIVNPEVWGLATSDDGVVCLFARGSPVVGDGALRLRDVFASGSPPVLGGMPALSPGASLLLALESVGVESGGLDATGVFAV